ncbi:hypothetical protein BB561_001707 [Smittium simulii]|uniref:Steroid 5-alpha reductase C-terminal domain-containing protein n=1 Tax=Smittium simulii TaxID=133385 RepID=A0A2T9YTE5_9FUNG|nr:hypothetical protein BB561_001707 [Smittium simulii]
MHFPAISSSIVAFASHLASRQVFTLSPIDNFYAAAYYPDPFIKALALTIFFTLSCWLFSLIPLGSQFRRNYSHVDRCWSILPIFCSWVYFGYQVYTSSGFATLSQNLSTRTFATTLLVTIWGCRLTFNAIRKGYYSFDYEDYRWEIVTALIKNPILWEIFNFLFIAGFQVFLLFALTWPVYYIYLQEQNYVFSASTFTPLFFKPIDYAFIAVMLLLLLGETVSDQQQWDYHQQKKLYAQIEARNVEAAAENRAAEPFPFSDLEIERIKIGFVHTGLWKYSRHPNFFCEQAFWVTLAVYSYINGAHVTDFNSYSFSLLQYAFGAFILVILFAESTTLTESISETKYPLYVEYAAHTSSIVPYFSNLRLSTKEKQS